MAQCKRLARLDNDQSHLRERNTLLIASYLCPKSQLDKQVDFERVFTFCSAIKLHIMRI